MIGSGVDDMVDLNCILTKAALPGHSTLPVTPGVILIFIFFFFNFNLQHKEKL